MKDDRIQLWHSKNQESHLANMASVWRSVAVDLTTGEMLTYTRAGKNPATDTVRDYSGNVRFRDDFHDARKIYDGPRSNLAQILVGSTFIYGAMTMAGDKLTREQQDKWHSARACLSVHSW